MPVINVSLDIETLSTHKNAVVLSIGAVAFDASFPSEIEPRTFVATLGVAEQIEIGRHVDQSTLDFWAEQPSELLTAQLRNWKRGDVAIIDLDDWLMRLRADGETDRVVVWTNGPSFDGAILESLCENYAIECPVGFRDWRDVRTIRQLAGDVDVPKPKIPHDPLQDAIYQAQVVVACARKLGVDLSA